MRIQIVRSSYLFTNTNAHYARRTGRNGEQCERTGGEGRQWGRRVRRLLLRRTGGRDKIKFFILNNVNTLINFRRFPPSSSLSQSPILFPPSLNE